MKVKDLIAKLQKLDQEKNIWVFYGFPYACDEPSFLPVDKFEADNFRKEGCKPGDYAHYAG